MELPDSRKDMLLGRYRVLDLTDERGLLCGMTLAHLGADVIQIEPPGGSTARKIGPYYNDQINPENSLFWWAYAINKRGITLNLNKPEGLHIFKRLVQEADFLLESNDPGYMDHLGVGYKVIKELNPNIVMVSISAFGQDGPYAGYKATDIVGMSMGGFTYLTGDADRPPLRLSFPHFYLHGSAAGAASAMIAHMYRAKTGVGQHVDVSCQQAVARTLAHAPQFWDMRGVILKRTGPYRQTSGDARVRTNWQCKNGWVNYVPQGGGIGVANSTRAMLEWMTEEGFDVEEMRSLDWNKLGYGEVPGDVMERAVAPMQRFYLAHTKEELFEGSMERRIFLFPLATYADILHHPQLEARSYFVTLAHSEKGGEVTYPGSFVKDETGDRVGITRRSPLIGEHNHQIYVDEMGLSPDDITALGRQGVI